jgi:hypothetical protein
MHWSWSSFSILFHPPGLFNLIKSRNTWYSLTQERFFDYMYKVWFLPKICQFFLIETCIKLQKSFLLSVTWTFNYSGCCHKVLLWGSLRWEIHITCNHGQGNGLGPERSYHRLHQTFASLWPNFWSRILEIDSIPLWYELKPINAYHEATYFNFYIGHEWAKGILVETLKLI